MSGFQPYILPGFLSRSSTDGFEQVKTLKTNIKQNLKMLLLTSPGERIGSPNFGVGIKRFLFEMSGQEVYAEIDSKIKEQVSLFLPYLKIIRVQFLVDEENENKVNLKIVYSVPRISLTDELFTEVL